MERDKLEYPNQINWHYLAEALDYYKKQEFEYIEVPWIAPTHIMKITFPGDYRFKTTLGDPVASGEQSFLHLQLDQGLKRGKYMTITPCFRDEPETEWNFKQFIKLELYVTLSVSDIHLKGIIGNAHYLFERILKEKVERVQMEDGSYDLTCKGIELGSYGIREYDSVKWIYATGLAEPRTSMVKKYANFGAV